MTESTPSWVGAAPRGAARSPRRPVPPRLAVAAGITTAMAAAETWHVAGRDELVPGLRVFLVLVVLSQVGMGLAASRLSSGAALGLLVCQVTTVLAALAGGFGELRLALAAGAVAVLVLLSTSLGSFPSIELPPLERGGSDG